MFRRLACGLMILGGCSLLAACAAEKKPLGIALQTNDLVYSGTPEAVPDKVNIYTAMARAAKYNADTSAQNMMKKIYDGNENPLKIVEGIFNAGQSDNRLYNAAKAMDFADMYAMSILTDNQKYIENTLYAKSAQNLTIAAIVAHREEIFAEKQIKVIDRLSAQQGKILRNLNQKMERNGDLTEPELNYRKNLEVALNRLGEIKSRLQFVSSEYAQLIKASDKNLDLEGKRFYELDDFDKRYNPDIFQDSAINNRREFSLAKEKLGGFNAAKARRQAYVDYPPVARLDINGLEIEDSRYEKELFNKAKRVTVNLLNAAIAYQENPKKENLRQKAFDELAALVMTQVELAYRQVEKASFAYEANRYKIGEVKDTIRKMEKKGSMLDYEKTDLLNKRIELIVAEQEEAQILSERAAALRNLYYLAGLSPFDKNILKGRIKDIETVLKHAFNKDVIDMLSAVKDNPRWDDGGNAWAHKDNWLEELIDGNPKSQPKNKSSTKKVIPLKKTVTAEAHHSMMQLGAYTDMDNAMADKNRIKQAVSALSGEDMFIEEAVVNGVVYHRLIVKPETVRLQELCSQVINAGFACILK